MVTHLAFQLVVSDGQRPLSVDVVLDGGVGAVSGGQCPLSDDAELDDGVGVAARGCGFWAPRQAIGRGRCTHRGGAVWGKG